MMFDNIEYAEALDEFLIKMEQIPDLIHPGTQDALNRICQILRVAKVEVTFYETPRHEAMKKGNKVIFYEYGNVDANRVFYKREKTSNGNIAVYKLYQKADEPDWNAVEYEKITVLAKMIFTFNGRIRIMHIAEELTYKDQELGIFSLRYFMKHAGMLIEQHEIADYAACYFNLRRFSLINQQIGRERGTKVMKSFVRQLQDRLTSTETVCRIGGDNFAVLFLKDHLDVVMDYLKGTEIIYEENTGESVIVMANAGYYMIPDDCEAATSIVDSISAAVNIAKNVAKKPYVFFDEEMVKQQSRSKQIESIFPESIEKEEFKVYYQPKILLKDYKLAGAEALCRWYHDGKLISPGDFIPVLEQTKAICILDFYMLEHVCKDIRRWLDEGRKVVKVSVNLSRRHMGDVFLLENILAIIDKYHVPHEYIEIELTETTTDVDFSELKNIVSGLHEQGISTSVDDFGMGYSSLNLIRELPWNVLKIDKSFLPEEKEDSPQKYVMLKHLIALSQDMGLECIVEGVETVEHVKLLKENNCYLAQGFYFDRPLPVNEFEKRLLEMERNIDS